MLTFRIVEVAAQLFSDPSGPFASYAADIFEILSLYFPIHFTHVRSLNFGYTCIFLPYVIMYIVYQISRLLMDCPLAQVR